jgi:azurin
MKRALLFLLFFAAAAVPSQVFAQGTAAKGRLIEIEGNDQMKFNVTTIQAKPGETLTVRLKNVGTMPKIAMGHNFVLLKAGADATTFANESALAGPAANYVAAARKADVLAATNLTGPKETAEVTFTVPKQAGSHTYLCSFPGHFAAGMRGTLVVK